MSNYYFFLNSQISKPNTKDTINSFNPLTGDESYAMMSQENPMMILLTTVTGITKAALT